MTRHRTVTIIGSWSRSTNPNDQMNMWTDDFASVAKLTFSRMGPCNMKAARLNLGEKSDKPR